MPRDFFLRRVRVGNHAEHGQAELFLDVLGRADLAVEHGVSDDRADADEQAEHGHDGHDEQLARLDGLFGKGRFVDDLDFIWHHDFGDFRFFEAFGEHDVDFVRDVDVALDAHIALFLLWQGLDELLVLGVHRVERGLLALGDGNGGLILELVGEQALLDRARGRRLLGDDLADLFIEGLASLGDLVVDLLDFRVLIRVLADVARARALELGELVLVLLDGRAVGDGDARALELAVDAALPKKLVLDLSGVTFMDSSGIALILRAQQRMKLLDGSLLVCGVPQQARRVLDAAGIGRLVTIR